MHMDWKRLMMRPHARCPSVPANPTVWLGRSQTVSDTQTLLRGLGHPHSPPLPPVALGVGFPGALSSHSTFHVSGLYKQFTTVPRSSGVWLGDLRPLTLVPQDCSRQRDRDAEPGSTGKNSEVTLSNSLTHVWGNRGTGPIPA